ncbi:MAG TPA: nucleotidyltransferase family protein, partial [Alphaproteobacteria bacterium]|nr:nucleotidyltransferase family protein [Alphaproteobacteria bacterium]
PAPPERRMIVGILLAGGASTRFGSDKLMAKLPDGRTVAQAAAQAMVAALEEVIAVVRPGNEPLEQTLRATGCEVIVCEKSIEGMGASIACGVAARPDADGWVIGLADMPWIEAATVWSVATELEKGAAIAAPTYAGQRGHPVGFAGRFGKDLAGLTEDVGARHVVKGAEAGLKLVATDDRAVLRDIDRPEDMA